MRKDFDWKKTYYNLAREVDQVLGQALGYPLLFARYLGRSD